MSVATQAVLDACVLATFALCDTLLRLAEPPSLYEPRWSAEIMAETVGTLELRLGWQAKLASYFQSELQAHFGDAWVTDRHEPAIAVTKLRDQAADRNRTLQELLNVLAKTVPRFVELIPAKQ